MSRHFTLEQARRMLPDVREAVSEAIRLKAEYQEAESALNSESRRLMMLGGALVDRRSILSLKGRRDTAGARLKDAVEAIHELGCLVKDLDVGLLDFPTFYRGEEVYLCWKLGEEEIRFWHGVDEGFRGRKPIDQDFLDHHEGDRPS